MSEQTQNIPNPSDVVHSISVRCFFCGEQMSAMYPKILLRVLRVHIWKKHKTTYQKMEKPVFEYGRFNEYCDECGCDYGTHYVYCGKAGRG